MAYKLQWNNKKTLSQGYEIYREFVKDQPKIVMIDTETTGLNITKDTPFLLVVAWKVPGKNEGKSFVMEWNNHWATQLFVAFSNCRYVIGANLKYDLHMIRNGGSEFPFEILNNHCELTDIQIMRVLTNEADLSEKEQSVALKYLGTVLVDKNANADEQNVKTYLKEMNDTHNKILNAMLKPFKLTKGKVQKIIEDCRYGWEALQPEVANIYKQWLENYGDADYYKIYKDHKDEMVSYAYMDGVLTIEVFLNLYEKLEMITSRTTQKLWELYSQENSLIPIYYQQEKIGFSVDLEYLKECKQKTVEYNALLEAKLNAIAGKEVSVNSNPDMIWLLTKKLGVPETLLLETDKKTKEEKVKANKDIFLRLNKDTTLSPEVKYVIKLVTALRRLRKWISTYIDNIYNATVNSADNKFHPETNQAGAVSGRISGNMQQMPKNPLTTIEGEELFHPRKCIVPTPGYKCLVLQDFDQMELRLQANYTIEFDCIDKNLCHIFIPLGCENSLNNFKVYDIINNDDLAHYNDKSANGESIWWEKTGVPWNPLDPHSMQVKTAFGLDKPSKDATEEEQKHYKHLRNAAKTINFAINYGSTLRGLLENPMLDDYPKEIIETIYKAYKTNFEGVGIFQKIVDNDIKNNGFVSNMYGRVYRVKDAKWAYKCANYLIQGTGADLVKFCLISINDLLKQLSAKSRVLYTIHDEVIWELADGEEYLIKWLELILTKSAIWSRIPLTCGTDLAFDNWANKKDISEFKEILNGMKTC